MRYGIPMLVVLASVAIAGCSSSAGSGAARDTGAADTGGADVSGTDSSGDAEDAAGGDTGLLSDTDDEGDAGDRPDGDVADTPQDGEPDADAGSGDADADADGSGDDTGPAFTALALTPSSAELAITSGGPAAVATFAAMASVEGASDRDVSDLVEWRVDDRLLGDVREGVFTTSGVSGGTVVVTAKLGDLQASAPVRIRLDATFVPPGEEDPDLPGDFDDGIARAEAGDRLTIVYPNHETMFPQNIHRVRFEWAGDGPYTSYRLHFVGELVDFSVFTTGTSWTPEPEQWRWMARSAAGASLTWSVEGAIDAETVEVSESITLLFSPTDVPGAIYYWSTTTQAVMRGAPSEAEPELFYPEDGRTCVACHAVSRDGRRLAVGYDGEDLQVASIPERETLVPAGTWDMGWATFSPDGERLLIARRGQLRLVETDTGNPIGPNEGVLDYDVLLTHPDWAPSGRFVVAVTGSRIRDKEVEQGSIVRIPIDADVFGDIEVLVESAGERENNFFPAVSPDSSLVAFVSAHGNSKDQETSELRLVRVDDPGRVVAVERLNHRVNNARVADVGTSMPTWAPSTSAGTQWLAFSSLRDYATVVTGGRRDQLWIAAIDPDLVGVVDSDPSFSAFWIPFQDPAASNHRAFWAFDPEVACAAVAEVCDGFDNDCDGEVDEDCVPCEGEEVCDDRIDNDCDGAVDEGCADPECVDEICRDGIDNDCDDAIDEGCPECVDEICDDDIDNDCDGEVDEGCSCTGREICYDHIDNDCDGILDPPPPLCDPE